MALVDERPQTVYREMPIENIHWQKLRLNKCVPWRWREVCFSPAVFVWTLGSPLWCGYPCSTAQLCGETQTLTKKRVKDKSCKQKKMCCDKIICHQIWDRSSITTWAIGQRFTDQDWRAMSRLKITMTHHWAGRVWCSPVHWPLLSVVQQSDCSAGQGSWELVHCLSDAHFHWLGNFPWLPLEWYLGHCPTHTDNKMCVERLSEGDQSVWEAES